MKKFLNDTISEMNKNVLNGETKLVEVLKKNNETSEYFDNNGAHLKSILEFLMFSI
jgi:hypothetical protein